jgi:hypothetical protein
MRPIRDDRRVQTGRDRCSQLARNRPREPVVGIKPSDPILTSTPVRIDHVSLDDLPIDLDQRAIHTTTPIEGDKARTHHPTLDPRLHQPTRRRRRRRIIVVLESQLDAKEPRATRKIPGNARAACCPAALEMKDEGGVVERVVEVVADSIRILRVSNAPACSAIKACLPKVSVGIAKDPRRVYRV